VFDIRRPRPDPDDLRHILAVHLAAFGREDEAALVRRLRDDGDSVFELLAEVHGDIVGHIQFSPVRIAHGDDGRVVGLAPLAVRPDWQRQGVGHALLEQSLAAMRAAGDTHAVVVLGDPAYYTRFGFEPASRHGLHDTYGGGDAFMAIALNPQGLHGYQGQVRYAPAFDLLTE